MDSLFTQNPGLEPFFTMQLGRRTEILSAMPGTITFGEVLPEFANITSQPKLSVFGGSDFVGWVTTLSGMSVNGQNVSLPPGSAPGHPEDFIVLLDSGTSSSSIPVYAPICYDVSGSLD
jgi:hypothetical protein